jgi:4-hydroxy-tetrahydrodipicolinate synthase
MLKRMDGICPAVFVIYTDATCRTIDEQAYRAHIRFLAEHDLGSLVIGGHAGEIPALTLEEQVQLIGWAREECQDRIPVCGGIVTDSTREAIRQGLAVKQAGAAAVMITPPAIPGWNGTTDARYYIKHLGAFEEHVGLPITLIGAPAPEFGTAYYIAPDSMREIVRSVESIIAVKVTSSWNLGAFLRIRDAVKEARDISFLQAGAQNTFGTFLYGADGNLSGATNFRPGDDVEILRAIRAGELEHARTLADSWNRVTDVMYGMQVGLPVVPFHYRYKVVAWLMGIIDRPHMRLPQLPPPLHEIEMLRDALLACEKPVVREAEELEVASAEIDNPVLA